MTPLEDTMQLHHSMDIFKTLSGHWRPRLLHLAVKMGIVEALTGGPLPAGELARRAGVKAEPLSRVLRGLVHLGVLAEPETDAFHLTELGSCLRAGAPEGLAGFALLSGEEMSRAWDALPDALRTGETAFRIAYGQGYFDYYDTHPDRGRLFGEAMAGLARHLYSRVTSEYDFSPYRRVVDVGGGYGLLLSLVLGKNPDCTGVLFDRPAVVERAGELLGHAGVLARCERIGGDFFESVPPGGDLYVLSNIVHDWDDEPARRILRSCRRAMEPSSRLLLVEMVLSPGYEPELAREADLNMLVLAGGRERTAPELDALLSSAGFRRTAIQPVQPMTCLVEAVPAEP